MPLHERYGDLRNDDPKRGLDGRAAGPVEAAASVGDNPYALGDDTSGATTLVPGQPSITVSSPLAGQIQVVITADPDATSYTVYRAGTLIGTETTAGTKTYTGQPAGATTVTARSRDEDGREFTESGAAAVTVL